MKNICKRCKVPYEEHICYFSPCAGCPQGHSSFHKTIVESKEWQLWEKENEKRMNKKIIKNCFDYDECRELGIMSQKHWDAFIKFIKSKC